MPGLRNYGARKTSMLRRRLVLSGLIGLGLLATWKWLQVDDVVEASGAFEVQKSDEEWRRTLTKAQYAVLRLHQTERPGSSSLDHENRAGIYACAGCDLRLFSSRAKFDSKTGWPSFYEPLPDAIGTSVDRSLLLQRTEVHCRRCGGHLGHVFEDGPRPTGLRYCMNGVALKFLPQT